MVDSDDLYLLINRQMRRLLASFEASNYFGDEEAIIDAYEMATLRFPRSIVSDALANFLSGKVTEHDPATLPSAIQLAMECQFLDYEREAEEFDIGARIADVVANDPEVRRQADLAARQAGTSREVAEQANVVPLRRGPATESSSTGGAA